MINGQTGTGKSYIARKFFDYCVAEGYIPSNGKFVSFNCAEYADNPELLTSTLFGYAKGSFTGAETAHNGLLMKQIMACYFLMKFIDWILKDRKNYFLI
ncbi:sigma 54-interacting transcriptional regulator [Lactobacillus sp. R2/2]|nr:sigma 54-interacting transcriptional regulator [Lactobacillus sp. R2/2]